MTEKSGFSQLPFANVGDELSQEKATPESTGLRLTLWLIFRLGRGSGLGKELGNVAAQEVDARPRIAPRWLVSLMFPPSYFLTLHHYPFQV